MSTRSIGSDANQSPSKKPKVGEGVPKVHVGIIGFGVSSIKLMQYLEEHKIDFRVVATCEFGIWDKAIKAGQNFDLVTTKESTNFSNWDFMWKFPFYTAKQYLENLQSEVTPYIRQRKITEWVHYAEQREDGYILYKEDGSEILRCTHLVCSLGFQPDANIITNMKKCEELENKHVLIQGMSDTANMYISRLMLNNNRVTIISNHFTTLDKLSDVGVVIDGKRFWFPFDQGEPYHQYAEHNEFYHHNGASESMTAPFINPTWLNRLQRRNIGLDSLFKTEDFEVSVPISFWYPNYYRGHRADMLPTKYWSVEAYFDYYTDEDKNLKEWMLKNKVYLNDPYFFMVTGDVKLYARKRCKEIDAEEKKWEIDDGNATCTVNFDEVISSDRAQLRTLDIRSAGTSQKKYTYEENLYGIWHKDRPNLYHVGNTRPQTGAFGSNAEISNQFVFMLITDQAFKSKITKEFDPLLSDWHRDAIYHPKGGIKEAEFSGQYAYRLATLMGTELTFWTALKEGLWDAYFGGADNMLRYTIEESPFKNSLSAQKYKEQVDWYMTGFAQLVQFECGFPHAFFFNLWLLMVQVYGWAAVNLVLLGCLWVNGMFVYRRVEKAFRAVFTPCASYAYPMFTLRMMFPCVVVRTAFEFHWIFGTLLAVLSLPLYARGNFMPLDPVFFLIRFVMAALGYGLAFLLTTYLPYGLEQLGYGPWAGLGIALQWLLRSGISPGALGLFFEAIDVWNDRQIFNDCRPKFKPEFKEKFKRYLQDYRDMKKAGKLGVD
jgi:hypothetical protein